MPTKQVTYRNDKAVIVRVYVEKPRVRKKRSSSHHHHNHYHIHHTVRQDQLVQSGSMRSYGRRAGLLKYSHLLRESARRTSSIPSFSKWVASNNLQPPTQIAPSNKKKPECGEKPTCFGSLKLLLIPRCLRSWSKSKNKEEKKKQILGGVSGNGMRMLQLWKGKSFLGNVFSTKHKHA